MTSRCYKQIASSNLFNLTIADKLSDDIIARLDYIVGKRPRRPSMPFTVQEAKAEDTSLKADVLGSDHVYSDITDMNGNIVSPVDNKLIGKVSFCHIFDHEE